MCDAYMKNNVEVTLYVSNNKDPSMLKECSVLDIYSVDNKIEIKTLPVNYFSKVQKFLSLSIFFPFSAFLNKSTLIHSRTLISAYVLAKIFNQNVIFEIHDAVWKNAKSLYLFKSLVKSKHCKFLISITSSLANDAKNVINEGKPILVLPDGVSEKNLHYSLTKSICREDLGLTSDEYTIIYAGHLYEGRGINLIITLAQRLPLFRFIVLGGNENDVSFYRHKTENIENIQFLGFKSQEVLLKYLIAADALVMPYENKVRVAGNNDSNTSKYASPLKMFEYMATGRPIVSSTLPVLSEILRDQHNALMVPYDDVEGWVKALQLLKDNPELGDKIAKQAKEDVKQYTWEKRAEKIINFYKSIDFEK